MVLLMQMRVSEATWAFLQAAADDLQRQLASSGVVVDMRMDQGDGAVALVATIRIGEEVTELAGAGDNLVEAYGDLQRHIAEPILAAAYRHLLRARAG